MYILKVHFCQTIGRIATLNNNTNLYSSFNLLSSLGVLCLSSPLKKYHINIALGNSVDLSYWNCTQYIFRPFYDIGTLQNIFAQTFILL